MDLYHADIRLPDGFVAPVATVEINYGSHARQEAMADRYGLIDLPVRVPLNRMRVIEVGVEAGKVSKILFRGTLDSERDICMVLVPARGPWFCKTVWVNLRSDKHATLDRSRYVR